MPPRLTYAAATPIADIARAHNALDPCDQIWTTTMAAQAYPMDPALTPTARRFLRWALSGAARVEIPMGAAQIAAALGRPPVPIERAVAALETAEAAGWLVLARDGGGEIIGAALDLRRFEPDEPLRALWPDHYGMAPDQAP